LENNILTIRTSELSVCSAEEGAYQALLLRNLTGEITCRADRGPVKVTSNEPALIDNFFKTVTGQLLATEGTIDILLNGFAPLQSGMFIPSPAPVIPWLSVEENVRILIKINNGKSDREDIREALALVGLEGYETHIPHQKSSGFRTRIALAGALAIHSPFIMLAEPVSETGKLLRDELVDLYFQITAKNGIPVLFGWAANTTLSIPHTTVSIENSEEGTYFQF
jgi:ABC-type uncharacterized transport system YnjBCD ATPase subunit